MTHELPGIRFDDYRLHTRCDESYVSFIDCEGDRPTATWHQVETLAGIIKDGEMLEAVNKLLEDAYAIGIEDGGRKAQRKIRDALGS
jgi:hypothetical protein